MTATAPPADIDALLDEFALLDDWEDRYRHIIELGRELQPLSDDERIDANKVKGCVSQVWLIPERKAGPPPRVTFRADSDAHIVRGLAAILIRMLSGRGPEEIAAINPRRTLDRLGLAEHLSPQRSNGLAAMLSRMLAEAGVQEADV